MLASTSALRARTSASRPQVRTSSIERRLSTVARGCEDSVVRRSMRRTSTRRRASSMAAARPAGPAPATRTGISCMRRMLPPAIPGRLSKGYSMAETSPMRWPLAGRSEELAMVAAALPRGGVVISGSAGVGKTRLATEAARVAAERGFEVAWVRATRSAATIPLGAFAPLLPTVALPEGAELLARARGALAERADGRRLVLIVDDGQLLDDASAALLHQLVAAGETCAAVTVRADEPVPDALRALWKDELCALLDLGPLSRAEVDQLLAAALGGPVDGRSIAAMRELTRATALFLGEPARRGVDRGHWGEDGGVGRWRGRVEAGTRLAELVDLRIDGLDARARALL